MKKILKVKIKRDQDSFSTRYTYPVSYNPQKIQVLAYETQISDKEAGVKARGNKDEYMLGFVDEADVPSFLVSPDIVEVNRAEAETFLGADLDKTILKIIDSNSVIAVLSKHARGEALSQEDKDVIDPKKPGAKIMESRSFRKVLDEYGF